jgi:hypothetical protein
MVQPSEKAELEYVQDVERKDTRDTDMGSVDYENEFTPEQQKKIIHRVDRRLVTTVGFMYCISLMDRTNLGAANIAGMATDLILIKNRYVSNNSQCIAECP